jgi:hypothetical protein
MIFLMMLGCVEQKADTGMKEAEYTAVCSEPAEISCVDDLILDLSLHDDKISDGLVSTSADGADFISSIDATAGGYNQASNNPWLYVRFTDEGVEKLELDDEEALESMEWDMAFHRFNIRINGGASGPSCVGAVTFLEQSYSDLTEVPEGLSYQSDSFYTGDCTMISDSSGLPNSPQLALGAWWTYPGCVATTGYPHLIQTAEGRLLKLVVEQYYAEDQDVCNSDGAPGSNGGNIQIRWQMMN